MEKLYGHRLEAEIERLAYHAFRGELWTQAASYLEQAGDKAMARCAFADATAWFEQAITTHAHLPQTREALEQGIDIRFDLRNALIQVGDTERMHEHLIDAQRIAQDIGDQPRLARASGYLSYAFLKAGNYQRALEAGQLAIDIGEALGNRPLILEMDFRLGQVYAALGQYGRALTLLDHRAQLGESEALRDPLSPPFPLSLHAKEWMGYCMARTGDFAVGIPLLEGTIPLAEESGQPFALAAVYYSLCELYVRQGLMDKATPVLERAFALGLAKELACLRSGSAIASWPRALPRGLDPRWSCSIGGVSQAMAEGGIGTRRAPTL